MEAKEQIKTSHAGLRIFEMVMNARTDQDFSDAVKKMGLFVSVGKIGREEEANLELLIARQAVLHMRANEGTRKRNKRADLSTELASGYTSWFELAQKLDHSAEHTQVSDNLSNAYCSEFRETEIFTYETDYIKARAFDELSAHLPKRKDEARELYYTDVRMKAQCFGNFLDESKPSIFSHIVNLFYPEDKREHINR